MDIDTQQILQYTCNIRDANLYESNGDIALKQTLHASSYTI